MLFVIRQDGWVTIEIRENAQNVILVITDSGPGSLKICELEYLRGFIASWAMNRLAVVWV